MRDVIEMAREAGAHPSHNPELYDIWSISDKALERFAELVRADEREQGQKWFDAVTAQHKQAILAEREACAKVCENQWSNVAERMYGDECAAAIRARSNT